MDDHDLLRMTPGPTEVPERVRERMAEPSRNPDVEPEFVDFYRDLTEKLDPIYGDGDVAILGGEGILGLEAAVASLVDSGDEVLCIANGLYGEGFADFVDLYDGKATVCGGDWREPIDVDAVERELETGDYAVATMVHCETPTGVLNDLEPMLDLLAEHDVISVVDAVSSLGGTPVPTDRIDVVLGATQKCFSAPPGLTVCAVSDRAWARIESVETRSFYASLEPWKTVIQDEWFPYTHLTANLQALDAATDLLLEEGLDSVYARHEAAAERCRERADDLGLEVYPDDSLASPTVTALDLEGRATDLQAQIREEHGIVLSTGLGDLEDDILRIGHMGNNAQIDRVDRTMDALEAALE
ncbi:pyridoxal-phosphate-dependent aminotransferase family protein [Natronosalvus halobius]|uniref:pyridoxal-phosphate-dependent aminotransferase family protein n=1 Tax=Natronosalvus halobius TaxID=2953746 RepID=UPI00209E2FC5|nr:alanine--glyoxylate aminotransferase family protein [Natronosalvus halobius]USZ71580.1 alanine--glyoxylate aminotransferase family protein [Natronosalvus halobius]